MVFELPALTAIPVIRPLVAVVVFDVLFVRFAIVFSLIVIAPVPTETIPCRI